MRAFYPPPAAGARARKVAVTSGLDVVASRGIKSKVMFHLLKSLSALLFGMIATASAAEGFYEFEHKGPDPDHLLIVSGYPAKELDRTIKELKFPSDSLATMVTVGPFGGGSGVCLKGLLPEYIPGDAPDKMVKQKYQLIFASRPAIPEKSASGPLTTTSVEVPMDFAIPMQRLWVQFVLSTGHRPCAEWMLDGDTQYFTARPGEDFISGSLRNAPEGGLCEKMSKLAKSLEDLKDLSGDLKEQKLEVLRTQIAVLSRQFPALNDESE
ncbi:MAG: hypothetical protein JWO82_404 [Akkermansiaceae bacterium]|nr:hypothetical protein [Akkermansiaceae bacterium]